MDFKFKSKSGGLKERPHTDLKIDGVYVGYLISERDNEISVHNWYFVPTKEFFDHKQQPDNFMGSFAADTKQALIELIKSQPNKLI